VWQPTTFAPEGRARPQEALHTARGGGVQHGLPPEAHGTTSNCVDSVARLLPVGTRLTTERPTITRLGKVHRASSRSLAQAGRTGNTGRTFMTFADHPIFISLLTHTSRQKASAGILAKP
jgi:hypothetical protein